MDSSRAMAGLRNSVAVRQVRWIRPGWLLRLVKRPALWALLTLAVHVAGRCAAVCAPSKFDSFVYAVAAYKFYDPAGTGADLVPDKPGGQALLTGWCYRLAAGPPSRLTLVPIESAFLLGGYLAFGLMVRRVVGPRAAGPATFLLALAINTFNTLDTSVAGLNVNENYLLLPMALAVWAHLAIDRPARRGLLTGLAIGTALTIKPTAGGLLVVLVVVSLAAGIHRRQWKEPAVWLLGFALGLVTSWLPLLTFLYARGWLWPHLHDLWHLSGRHMGLMPLSIPPWFKLVPLLPAGWWIVAALAADIAREEKGAEKGDATLLPERPEGCFAQKSRVPFFAWLWLAAEILILWAMTKPSAHFYQQLATPAALLAAIGLSGIGARLSGLRFSDRVVCWRWLTVVGFTLTVLAALPLAAEVAHRCRTFDRAWEVRQFDRWLIEWSPRFWAEPSQPAN